MVDDGRPLVLIIAVPVVVLTPADDDDGFDSCCAVNVATDEVFDNDDVFVVTDP
jgi:hypothetical protein